MGSLLVKSKGFAMINAFAFIKVREHSKSKKSQRDFFIMKIKYICVSCYSKTVFEYSRTRREPVYSKTVRPFLNSDAHI